MCIDFSWFTAVYIGVMIIFVSLAFKAMLTGRRYDREAYGINKRLLKEMEWSRIQPNNPTSKKPKKYLLGEKPQYEGRPYET